MARTVSVFSNPGAQPHRFADQLLACHSFKVLVHAISRFGRKAQMSAEYGPD
jgi:hypothetical protein